MIIYSAKSKTTGKIYIGKTTQSLERRKYSHIYRSLRGECNSHFYNAIRRYGADDFKWNIILYCENEFGSYYEKKIIEIYDTYNYKKGYNSTLGGEGSIGYKHNKKNKIKMSLIKKQYYKKYNSHNYKHINLNDVIKLRDNGYIMDDISKILNIDRTSLYKKLKKNGINFNKDYRLIRINKNDILKMIENGMTRKEIAFFYKTSKTTIYRRLHGYEYERS